MMTDDEILNKIDETTINAGRHQLETLQAILDRNAGVQYLRQYLRGQPLPFDATTFRRYVPLSSYDDYADYIHQMADGVLLDDDRPLLSADPLLCFFYSSGTSSMKPKLIPCFYSPQAKAISYISHQGSAAIVRRLFPPKPSVNKVLWFVYGGNVTTTKSGYKAMAATAFPLHSNKPNTSQFLSTSVSPKEVILGLDFQQQMYCHLLCGLSHSNVVEAIRAPYANGLIRAFSLLESKWEQLCEDLENGFPNLEVTDLVMRNAVIEVLRGSQIDLSKRIRSICVEKSWEGILRKLWPNSRYIRCVTTGSMEHYYKKLKYYAGDLPILGGDYFASECCVGINLDIMNCPGSTRFVMLPTSAYFEFLPFESNTLSVTGEDAVDFSCVEVGKMYEVVVTTFRGLYRYRLGDIVKVTGFYNSSPQVEFVMRSPKISTDTVTERDLISAMAGFQLTLEKETNTEIVEFAGFFELEVHPTQLKIFVEVRKGFLLLQFVEVLKRCCKFLEEGLGGVYNVMKKRGEVGPLLVSIVNEGSFNRLMQLAIENGASASQYKSPRIIRQHKYVDFMEASTLLSVSSISLDS